MSRKWFCPYLNIGSKLQKSIHNAKRDFLFYFLIFHLFLLYILCILWSFFSEIRSHDNCTCGVENGFDHIWILCLNPKIKSPHCRKGKRGLLINFLGNWLQKNSMVSKIKLYRKYSKDQLKEYHVKDFNGKARRGKVKRETKKNPKWLLGNYSIKVSKFQYEFMKSSFFPNIVRISTL